MCAELLKPIYSSRCDDPAFGEAVDEFVISLAEHIDMLQDAEADGDGARLAELTGRLVAEAEAAGFRTLARAAKDLDAACSNGAPEIARAKLLDLTLIAQRVRLGHKGSA